MPAAANARIEIRPVLHEVRSNGTEAFLDSFFHREVLPLVTPIALDRAHPLPRLRHGSCGLLVRFHGTRSPRYGVILVHAALPAAVEDPSGGRIPLAHVIARHVAMLFDEIRIESCWTFRVEAPGACAAGVHPHALAHDLAGLLERSERNLQESLPYAA